MANPSFTQRLDQDVHWVERRQQNKKKGEVVASEAQEREMDGDLQPKVFYSDLGIHETSELDRVVDTKTGLELGCRTSQHDLLRGWIWHKPH